MNLRAHFGGLGNRLFQLAFIYSQWRQGVLPDIYLQDYRLFDKCKEDLQIMWGRDLIKSDYISLHIRRGDYVDNPYYVDLTQTDYYQRAIAEFPGEKFLVFYADRQGRDNQDKEWCENFVKAMGVEFEIYQSEDEVKDWRAMAGCKGHIMANSSFSFWASYIGGGKVVAPSKWFADGKTIPLPDEWQKF